eukprot:m.80275 g.80275  ORF g.80275 m.80275 type:complete len:93 (-) comp12749_c0_seq5:1325-1603(-)
MMDASRILSNENVNAIFDKDRIEERDNQRVCHYLAMYLKDKITLYIAFLPSFSPKIAIFCGTLVGRWCNIPDTTERLREAHRCRTRIGRFSF